MVLPLALLAYHYCVNINTMGSSQSTNGVSAYNYSQPIVLSGDTTAQTPTVGRFDATVTQINEDYPQWVVFFPLEGFATDGTTDKPSTREAEFNLLTPVRLDWGHVYKFCVLPETQLQLDGYYKGTQSATLYLYTGTNATVRGQRDALRTRYVSQHGWTQVSTTEISMDGVKLPVGNHRSLVDSANAAFPLLTVGTPPTSLPLLVTPVNTSPQASAVGCPAGTQAATVALVSHVKYAGSVLVDVLHLPSAKTAADSSQCTTYRTACGQVCQCIPVNKGGHNKTKTRFHHQLKFGIKFGKEDKTAAMTQLLVENTGSDAGFEHYNMGENVLSLYRNQDDEYKTWSPPKPTTPRYFSVVPKPDAGAAQYEIKQLTLKVTTEGTVPWTWNPQGKPRLALGITRVVMDGAGDGYAQGDEVIIKNEDGTFTSTFQPRPSTISVPFGYTLRPTASFMGSPSTTGQGRIVTGNVPPHHPL